MATNNTTSDGFVDSVPIPSSYETAYNKACDEDRFLATSLTIPRHRGSVAIMMDSPAMLLIMKLEETNIHDPRRKERGFEYSGVKPATQVYSTGNHRLGDPYMAVIPFYISGKARIGEQPVEMKMFYHIFGQARLLVDEGAKLGAWVYKLGT